MGDELKQVLITADQLRTRTGDVKIPHGKRALEDRESARWLTTAAQAKDVLAAARMITVINDREGDFYAHWARTPHAGASRLRGTRSAWGMARSRSISGRRRVRRA